MLDTPDQAFLTLQNEGNDIYVLLKSVEMNIRGQFIKYIIDWKNRLQQFISNMGSSAQNTSSSAQKNIKLKVRDILGTISRSDIEYIFVIVDLYSNLSPGL